MSFLFVLLRISPGGSVQKYLSPQLSPHLAERVRESFNLNESIAEQYKAFLLNAVQGDFGISYNYMQPVNEVLWQHVPFTLFLAFTGMFVQILFGFLLAVAAVKKMHGLADKFLSRFSLMMYSIPSFVVGVFLIYLFSSTFNIFPSSGLKSYNHYSYSFWGKIQDYIVHLVLPVVTITFGGIAVYFKYLRDNLEEIYNKTFVTYLRANGFTEKEILLKHVIPNAVNPLISVAGVELGILFGGALITEVIFGLPGMGRLTINAILSRDYPLVIGCTFISGVFVILSNIAADLIKVKIDKRLLAGVIN